MLLCGFSSAKITGPFAWAAFHAFCDVVFEKSVYVGAFSSLCRYARCQVGKSTVPCSQKPPHQTAASVVPAPRKGSPW
jgi:hypothetical protein